MSAHTIIAAVEWTLGIDIERGAPAEPLHEAQCTTCGETSGATEGRRLPAEVWALQHTGSHPGHRSYRAVQTTFWRVTPASGNPYGEQS
ncbi:hypothetical protein SLUN_08205 [Streptomyces lunaelactis]|uniref:DUF7848 domain-containing protein n=1 Tax=Streptomyces lunaelactis TaxID=1535768 RepID=A0A2R4SZ78_9ACTN|nr:hypothetical protein [Streptomyces lunaelactis]AVZ72186.1 hypothetical protein SLUN_08205 [Streptomyces lunaelactis]NUK87827.1 hypothetical protein [Streptomyces lunaelactis]